MSTGLTKLARAGVVDAHRTLADRAFAALHDSIVAGHLAPGERLPIEELGVALGMSAMPIREALRRLDAAGLVENIPHRGGRVTQLSIPDLAQLYGAAPRSWLLQLVAPLWETSQRYRLAKNVAPKLVTRRGERAVILRACID